MATGNVMDTPTRTVTNTADREQYYRVEILTEDTPTTTVTNTAEK